ncbi:hypothetical protein ACFSJY_02380 [Thalassotalea euphylliae]|uniref:hypothetical protein n=1 Tax=Thalassotalea euphylliae TaxID=1655234 RepID=UPI00363CC67B
MIRSTHVDYILSVWLIQTVYKLFPQYAYKLLKRKLLTPNSRAATWGKSVKQTTYKTKYGKVRTYSVGEGKVIWLVHGWTHAIQFTPLMKKLVKQGYCCVAIEFLPNSVGDKVLSAQQWSNTFDVVSRRLPRPYHVVAHGLSASVVGNSKWLKNSPTDLTLISPVLDWYQSLARVVSENKLPKALFNELEREIHFVDKVRLSEQNATQHINAITTRLSVFYSKKDGTSTVGAVENLTEKSQRKFAEFKGASTDRMINSRSLLATISQSPKKLDIAV